MRNSWQILLLLCSKLSLYETLKYQFLQFSQICFLIPSFVDLYTFPALLMLCLVVMAKHLQLVFQMLDGHQCRMLGSLLLGFVASLGLHYFCLSLQAAVRGNGHVGKLHVAALAYRMRFPDAIPGPQAKFPRCIISSFWLLQNSQTARYFECFGVSLYFGWK